MEAKTFYEKELRALNEKASKLSELINQYKKAVSVFETIRKGKLTHITVRIGYYMERGGYTEDECVLEKNAQFKIEEAVNHTITDTEIKIEQLLGV